MVAGIIKLIEYSFIEGLIENGNRAQGLGAFFDESGTGNFTC